jgi:hypothetical protein
LKIETQKRKETQREEIFWQVKPLNNRTAMKVRKLWFSGEQLFIETAKGEIFTQPLQHYPRLHRASARQRAAWEQTCEGLHWEAIDEDISFESFFYDDNDPQVVRATEALAV